MKKKVFFALTLIMVGIMAVGCGSQEKISTTQAGQRNTGNEQAYGSEKIISQEEAVAIVLEKVNGASAEHVFIELEEDDGQWKYEGEIHYNQQEYEFEVNAMNGTILEWSEEGIDD